MYTENLHLENDASGNGKIGRLSDRFSDAIAGCPVDDFEALLLITLDLVTRYIC